MVWLKDAVKWDGHCMNCKKTLPKGTIAYCEVKGIFPNIKGVLCEDCFNKLHPNEKTVSQTGLMFRRFTLRPS